MCSTPASRRSASIDFQTAAATPGTVKAASPACGIVGRLDFDRADPLGQRVGDFAVCREAHTPEQLMQPRPLFKINAVDHQVEILFPVVDHVVAEQNLAEARAVGLHARISLVALDRRFAAEDHAPRASGQHRGAHVGVRRDKSKSPRPEFPPRPRPRPCDRGSTVPAGRA